MAQDGEWSRGVIYEGIEVLKLGRVFYGEVILLADADGLRWWEAKLNCHPLGTFGGDDMARARVEYEIATQIRGMREGWDRLRARGIPDSAGKYQARKRSGPG